MPFLRSGLCSAAVAALAAFGGAIAAARGAEPSASAPASLPAPSASASLPAPAPAAFATLSLFFVVDLEGAFASLDCRGAADLGASRVLDFATTVDGLDRARADALAAGELEPITLFGGNLVGPRPYGRTVLARPGGPAALAALLTRAGADHLSLGNHDFDPPPAELEAFLAAADARGLRTHLANADCDPAKTGLCKYLGDEGGRVARRYRILERGGFRVAVVSVIDDTLARRVAPGHAAGLTFRDPTIAAREVIYGLRKRAEADAIVLVANVEHSSTAPRLALALARSLHGDEAPDVIIANDLHPDGGGAGTIGTIRLTEGGPPILGSEPRGVRPSAVRLHFDRPAGRPAGSPADRPAGPSARVTVRVESVAEVAVAPDRFDPALRAGFIGETTAWCDRAGAPIGVGRLRRPLGAADLAAYTLEVMRRTTGAEVAMINAGAIDETGGFPLTSYISVDDLGHAIPYGDAVVVARVRGDELERFLKLRWRLTKLGEKRALRIVGPTTTDDGVTFKLNGRPIDPDVPYKVATLEFVATGGDDILEGFSGAKWKWVPHKIGTERAGLARLLEVWLAEGVRPRPRDPVPSIGVASSFPRLEDRFLYDVRFDLAAGLTDVTIRDLRLADEIDAVPQLAREQLTSLVADFKLALYIDNSEHAFDWVAHYVFGWGGSEIFDPSKRMVGVTSDVLTTEGIYRLRFFKKAVGPDRWYVPEPYVATFVESELIPAAGCRPLLACIGRTVAFTTGYRFRFHPKLEMKIGAGIKSTGSGREVLQPPVFVGELGFRLLKYKIGAPFGVPINLATEATAYASERFDDPGVLEAEVRATTVLDLALGFNLYFTLTQTFYGLMRYDVHGAEGERLRGGIASDLIAGLRVDLDVRMFDYE